jgi:hypothetical protein
MIYHEIHETHEKNLVPAEGRAGFHPYFIRGEISFVDENGLEPYLMCDPL